MCAINSSHGFFWDEMSSSQQLCLFLLSKCRSLKLAKQIHAYVYKNGLYTDLLVAGKLHLLCVVSISDALHYACCLLLQFPNPNAFMYNTLIQGLAESETPSDSLHTFVKMRQQSIILPDSFSFAFTLKVVANCRYLRVGLKFLSACAQAGAFEFGKISHGFIQKSGFIQIVLVSNALIDTYSRCGNVVMARLVFQSMLVGKNVVSWTSMIARLAMHGHGEKTIELFHEMEECGVTPDGITFISLLYACSHAGLVEQGCAYFSKMKNVYGIEPAIEQK